MRSQQNTGRKLSYRKRLAALRKKMAEAGVDVCFFENPIDLFYLTGLKLSQGRLFVHGEGARLFVDGRYIVYALKESAVGAALEGEAAYGVFFKECPGKKMAFDSVSVSYDGFLKLEALLSRLKTSYKLVPFPSFSQSLRVLKDKQEINRMRISAKLAYRGFEYTLKQLKVGITEKELARRFELFCLKEGAQKLAFDPIIAFGPNSAMPHHRPNEMKLQKGDLVLIDIGVVVGDYYSDMTRVVFFQGVDPFFSRVYDVVHASQRAALELCKPGVRLGKLDEAARAVLRQAEMERYFIHGLGHGVGLEIHEFPRIKHDNADKDVVLKPGMVITIEPGLYFPGKGGIRYEDTIVITPRGYENFFPEKNL